MPRSRGPDHLTISQLETILAKRRAKVTLLERQRTSLEKQLSLLNSKITALGGSGARSGASGRIYNAKGLPQTIIDVLTRHGGPMRVPEIVKGVLATGYRSSSDKFRGIVNQALIKDKRFVATERGVYHLKKGA
jgi:hypothetical protein